MPRQLRQLAGLPVTTLRGVGERKAEALEAIEIRSVLDLITHYPRRYLDRTQQAEVRDLVPGDEVMVAVTVRKTAMRRTRRGQAIVEVDAGDSSGVLRCTFFNQSWRAKQLPEGTNFVAFGKVDLYRGRKQMTNPVVDLIGDRTGRIIPIYPQSEKAGGLMTWEIAGWIEEALERAGELADPIPDVWRDSLDLADRTWAMRTIHGPESMAAQATARKRLAFDELFRLQTALVMRKRAVERESRGVRHVTEGQLVERFHARLPFQLTGAQRRAIGEVAADLAGPHPMHRLLQGDVGSGKTVIAATALLMAVQGGHQGALMVPTEVLAEQHLAALRDLLGDISVPDDQNLLGDRPLAVAILTNRSTASERAVLHAGLRDGSIDLLVGTHALIVEGVEFKDLAVVVIDEQHRFGVEQRATLRGKGDDPDLLVMTATPIPRTAAMTLYGDLDVTTLDELPPGRTPVTTIRASGPMEDAAAWETVRAEVRAGHQAYVVCPLVEESDRVEAHSAEEEKERLASGELLGTRVGLIHGRMTGKLKDEVMSAFRRRELDVLVATTVIEVGVDVPNATVMVIESADRFGIAQLHQLRGRVGRGSDRAWCYLLAEDPGDDGAARIDAMVRTTDGFELAEVDLELRGEGTILGTRQKGRSDLKLASLRRDRDLLQTARDTAFAIVDADPVLEAHPLLADEVRSLVEPEEADFLFKS